MLRLYIAGATSKSTQAVANIKAICEEYLAGRYELEVIDVYKEPSLIESGQIGVIPMLIKVHPHPPQRLIGNLSDTQEVPSALGLLEK
jgi:circadian clock protein KaiB